MPISHPMNNIQYFQNNSVGGHQQPNIVRVSYPYSGNNKNTTAAKPLNLVSTNAGNMVQIQSNNPNNNNNNRHQNNSGYSQYQLSSSSINSQVMNNNNNQIIPNSGGPSNMTPIMQHNQLNYSQAPVHSVRESEFTRKIKITPICSAI